MKAGDEIEITLGAGSPPTAAVVLEMHSAHVKVRCRHPEEIETTHVVPIELVRPLLSLAVLFLSVCVGTLAACEPVTADPEVIPAPPACVLERTLEEVLQAGPPDDCFPDAGAVD